MTTRFLVLSPDAATSAQLGDDLTAALEKRGSVTRIGALEGTTLPDAVATPDDALLKVVNTVRKATTDTVVIDGLADAPVRFFYTLGWNLDLAASTKAGIVLTLDTEGVPADLLKVEIEEARERAESHEAEIKAVALPASVASSLSVPGLVILPLPLTEESIEALVGTPAPTAMTPLAFQADLVDKARADRKRIVLPEPEDDRVLEAAAEVLQRGIADIILIGDDNEVRTRAAGLGFDISAATIVSVDNAELAEKYAVEFARLREKKGVTLEQARETIKDVSYFGTMMVHMGDADGMVSGARHTTAHTILPSFQIIKTAPGVSLVSSVFLMLMRDRMWAFGDCAVNPNPTPEQLADIAISSAETARQFGVDPKVAMLSYSTGTSGTGSDVDAIVEATRLAREKAPDLPIEGPIQFDAAVDPSVAATKLPDSPVAGNATVFIFPSLNAGNIGYKAVQRSSGAVAVGPVLQGLNKPVNDLSRGALVEDIVNTVALTAVQAQG
ncbi:MAG: phosphate acetyltransferase [Actinomycetaceae bacterium]|nr:phosphate acetyltransferase [Actinomycetaceae bacterium]